MFNFNNGQLDKSTVIEIKLNSAMASARERVNAEGAELNGLLSHIVITTSRDAWLMADVERYFGSLRYAIGLEIDDLIAYGAAGNNEDKSIAEAVCRQLVAIRQNAESNVNRLRYSADIVKG